MGVRASVSAVASLVVLGVLLIAAVALVTTQRAVLTDSVDEVLQRYAHAITAALDDGTLDEVIPGRGDEESFAVVRNSSGEIIAATAGAPRLDVTPPASGVTTTTLEVGPSGSRFRVHAEHHGDSTVIVGTPLDDVDDSVDALTRSLVIAVPVATSLLAVAIWLLMGRVLRPVERIRARVDEISGSSLDQRVPVPRTRDEIARLAKTMNSMLARLEATTQRHARFVSDASHELRSPLTRIRTALEVDLAHPETADLSATHRGALKDAERLQRLIDDLLLLARLDESAPTSRREPVDLDDIVLGEVQNLGPTTLTVDVSRVSAGQVLGDAAQLARVIRNLLDNALHHAATRIDVALAEDGTETVLSVADDGPGVPPEFREHVFERFARADDARTSDNGGTGLGLAIALELVTLHGGSLTLDAERVSGTRFVVRIPSA